MSGELQPDPPPRHSRSPATWAKLLAVWAVGLVSWTLYLIAILYLWVKFL